MPPGETLMSRSPALVLFVAFALIAPAKAFAQLTPPAGSAGAGNSSISGVPFGPANPRALSDPSGIGNAASVPPLRPYTPPPVTSYGAVDTPSPRARLATSPYTGASQRIISARRGQQLHGDLPGVLAVKLRFTPPGATTQKDGRFNVRPSRGTIFSCPTYARLAQRPSVLVLHPVMPGIA